jgi:hypothetical protein
MCRSTRSLFGTLFRCAPIGFDLTGGEKSDSRHFEIIVGKSVPEDREHRYFGLVQTHGDKPKRRLFEVLQDQGFQMNQDITFLTDGAESLRRIVGNMSPLL